ncbi:MAG: family 43 glycosylhydrolase [Bacillota bacterium]
MRIQLFKRLILAGLLFVFLAAVGFAQADNPLFTNIYTADPSPFVYDGRYYIVCGQDEAGSSTFNMYGWRLLSSADMETWADHGIIARPADYSWMPSNRAWASCIVPYNGKFYFYIATSNQVGVLVADRIAGPYSDPNGKALIDASTTNHAASDIDPMCFIDDDGQAYLFWGGSGECRYAKLNSDMISLKTNPLTVSGLTKYLEAPFVIKANNSYFLMYADSPWPSNIRYATASSISGPWTYQV